MLKALFIALACWSTAFQSVAASEDYSDWQPFAKEYVFAAEMLARHKDLDYWAMPLEEHDEGIVNVRAMIAHMQSVTHLENPLVVSFTLAGVRYDYNKGVSLAKDPLISIVEQELNTASVGKIAFIRCIGRYLKNSLPTCFVDYEGGDSFQKHLISKGFVTLAKNTKEVPVGSFEALKLAHDEAMHDERGIWTPFYFMMKGF